MASAKTPNIFSGDILARSEALRPSSFSASVAVPIPIALSPMFFVILAMDLSIFSIETPPIVAICRSTWILATVAPMLAANFAMVSTASMPFLVMAAIATTAMVPIAMPKSATFLAILTKPAASLPTEALTLRIFLLNLEVRAFTLIFRFPTVAIISPWLAMP